MEAALTIVVKLGGTNGSGKTAVARALLAKMSEPESLDRHTVGKINELIWGVLGSYKNVCGGMDTIRDKEERLALVYQASTNNLDYALDVAFFEGLITGKTYGAFGAMSEEPVHKGKWIYAFMDTPFDVCVARVDKRRTEKNGATWVGEHPLNPERTMCPTYKSVQATARKAAAQGHAVLWLRHQRTPAQIAQDLIAYVEGFPWK